MALIVGVSDHQLLARDLRLLGLTFVAPLEGCRCVNCQSMDTKFDTDHLAITASGQSRLIAWRDQRQLDYRTITIRIANDNGHDDSQAAKLIDGRSRADIYVQSYQSGVSWGFARDLRLALKGNPRCAGHQARLNGSGGQVFRVLCGECATVGYVSREGPAIDIAPIGRNADGTWGEAGWYSEAEYREWGW